jgi:hypothetical protein
MCEIMTIVAALAFTALYHVGKSRGRPSRAIFTTMLMFWGAALMWSVDCVANRLDGEALFDISREDTVLGFIILGAGLLVFGALSLFGRRQVQA